MVETNYDFNNKVSDIVYQAIMDNDRPIQNLGDFYNALQGLFNNPTEQNMQKIIEKYKTDQIASLANYVLVMANKADQGAFEQVAKRIEPMLESGKLSLPILDTIEQITKNALQQRVLTFFDKKISDPEFIDYYTSADGMKQLIRFHDSFLVATGCNTTEQKQEGIILNLVKTILLIKLKLVSHPETPQIEKNELKKSLEKLKAIPVFAARKEYFEHVIELFLEETISKDAAGAINPALVKKYTDIGIVFGDMIPGYNPNSFAQDMIKRVIKAKTEKLNKGSAKVSAKKTDVDISKYIKDHNEDQH